MTILPLPIEGIMAAAGAAATAVTAGIIGTAIGIPEAAGAAAAAVTAATAEDPQVLVIVIHIMAAAEAVAMAVTVPMEPDTVAVVAVDMVQLVTPNTGSRVSPLAVRVQ